MSEATLAPRTDQHASRRAPEFYWEPSQRGAHLVQLYDGDLLFLDSLEAWVAGGLLTEESVIVIATPWHRQRLAHRLNDRRLDTTSLQIRDQLIMLDAEDTLARFMRDGEPDATLFDEVVDRLIDRVGEHRRPVRAFGEMVVLLWDSGNSRAALLLEALWTKACNRHGFALLCAYPRSVFGDTASTAIRHVCDAHSSVVVS